MKITIRGMSLELSNAELRQLEQQLGAGLRVQRVLADAMDAMNNAASFGKRFNYEDAAKEMLVAETLIEMVEVFDCGSTGGYGNGQPQNSKLSERLKWLIKKYGIRKRETT